MTVTELPVGPINNDETDIDLQALFADTVFEGPIPLDENVFQPTELVMPIENMAIEEWGRIGYNLRRLGEGWQWWLGDWFNQGEEEYGQPAFQFVDEFSYEQVNNCARVARKIPAKDRRRELGWSLHRSAAGLSSIVLIRRALKKAIKEGFSEAQMREYVKSLKNPEGDPPEETEPTAVSNRSEFAITFYVDLADRDIGHKIKKEAETLVETLISEYQLNNARVSTTEK
jgi:hypothetical protein